MVSFDAVWRQWIISKAAYEVLHTVDDVETGGELAELVGRLKYAYLYTLEVVDLVYTVSRSDDAADAALADGVVEHDVGLVSAAADVEITGGQSDGVVSCSSVGLGQSDDYHVERYIPVGGVYTGDLDICIIFELDYVALGECQGGYAAP